MNIERRSRVGWALILVLLLTLGVTTGVAQTETAPDPTPTPNTEEDKPQTPSAGQSAVSSLRDVTLGMTVDDVRDKLGKPDVSDERGMLFTISKGESVQIGLDEKKTVRTIATMYGNDSTAPSITDIFGTGISVDAREDGTIYKMVRYPEAGFWLSYSRTKVADKPFVVIMMRRL